MKMKRGMLQMKKITENAITHFTAYLTLLVIMLTLTACSVQQTQPTDDKTTASFFAMDTYITVTAYGDKSDEAVTAAQDKITSLEKLWSVTDVGSEIYAANHNGSAELSDDTAELVRFALDMCRESDGALDISLYPVLTVWGFTTDEHHVPTDDELTALLENVGYDRITLDGNTLTVPDGMQIDLGAVGKGYAGDLAAQVLRDNGVTSALLDLGGNIQTIGAKPDGSPWKIGVRSPYSDGSFATLAVKDKAVITSGGYERYFEENGEVYWHILDPETGKPAHSGLLSITVIGDEGRLCDALSTSLFVMGIDKAEQLWRERSDFDFIAVSDSGEIYITEGVENNFELSENYKNLNVSVIR